MRSLAKVKEEVLPKLRARQIFGLISDEMNLVETEFERQASSNVQVIDYLADHIRAAGGKRVRPALLILANYALPSESESEIKSSRSSASWKAIPRFIP